MQLKDLIALVTDAAELLSDEARKDSTDTARSRVAALKYGDLM